MKSASQNKKSWDVFEVEALSEATEAIEFGFNQAQALGTEINNLGKSQPSETLSIRGYFERGKTNKKQLINHLEKALQAYGIDFHAIRGVRKRKIVERDWLASWKRHWKPVETEKFVISPSWKKINRKDKQIIYINPAMAFGTGTHETTRLCLQAIERFFKPSMTFLDVGTGTGILAIASAKLANGNNKKIIACDIDEESVHQAQRNALLNNVNIEIFHGSITKESPKYDFICANLTLEIILPLLPILIEKTNQILVLSGIMKDQKEKIRQALFKYQLTNYEIEALNEWIAVIVLP